MSHVGRRCRTYVAVTGSHGGGRVGRARARRRLLVVGSDSGHGTGADGVTSKLECTRAVEEVLSESLLVIGGEVEDEVADLALGLSNRQVEIEDGADVVGGHNRHLGGGEGNAGQVLGDGNQQAGVHVGLAEGAIGLGGVGRASLASLDLVGLSAGSSSRREGEGQGGGDGGSLHVEVGVELPG